jgi:hypothetical protein
MSVVVEVADDRCRGAGIAHSLHDLGDRLSRLVVVHRHANELGASGGERQHLCRRGGGVGSVGVRHRLHDNREG